MARMTARKGTGTKDWYAKFTRDGKSAGKLGPYVTRRAALEDAKVVLRAKVRGLVDEEGEPVRVLRVRDANNNEAGYEASDGSISVITASSGKATFNERVNPKASMASIKAANKAAGGHFFDRDTMRFFSSKVVAGPYGDRFFVTSERFDVYSPTLYTVREVKADGTISTVGGFQAHATKAEAVAAAKARSTRKNPRRSFGRMR